MFVDVAGFLVVLLLFVCICSGYLMVCELLVLDCLIADLELLIVLFFASFFVVFICCRVWFVGGLCGLLVRFVCGWFGLLCMWFAVSRWVCCGECCLIGVAIRRLVAMGLFFVILLWV